MVERGERVGERDSRAMPEDWTTPDFFFFIFIFSFSCFFSHQISKEPGHGTMEKPRKKGHII